MTVKCADLPALDSFKNISLAAGRSGLQREILWPYTKHLKKLSPWVHGGEFVMTSAVEADIDEAGLLSLIDEAAENDVAGLLVEGGVKLTSIPDAVRERADEVGMPLFFVPAIISFLDVSRDISNLILERQLSDRRGSALFEAALKAGDENARDALCLFESNGVPVSSRYRVYLFSLAPKKDAPADEREKEKPLKFLLKLSAEELSRLGLKTIARSAQNAAAFLVYAESEEGFAAIDDGMLETRKKFSALFSGRAILAVSERGLKLTDAATGLLQARFAAALMSKGLTEGPVGRFEECGSFALLFGADKRTLLSFRDGCLASLYATDRDRESCLLKTLKVFLESGGNVLRSSKILHIHRNTMQYRISRIEAATGRDLETASARLDLANALMIESFYPLDGD